MDTVLVLSEDSCYVAQYDEELDGIVDMQQIPFADITRIEFGQLEAAAAAPVQATSSSFNLGFLGGSGHRLKDGQQPPPHCVRLQYRSGGGDNGESGCLTFRSTGFRFFNNLAVPLASDEEQVESLKAVADAVAVAIETVGLVPNVWFGSLERRRQQAADSAASAEQNFSHELLSPASVAEPSVRPAGKPRNAGVAAALSNVTSQISRFNPIGKLMRPPVTAASTEIRFTDLQSSSVLGQPDDYDFVSGTENRPNLDRMSALYCPSSSGGVPPSIHVSGHNSGDLLKPTLTTSDVRRRRKISRSSENLCDNNHPIDNVLMPFAMLSQGLQSLGSNLVDNKLSRSCEQFMGLEGGGKGMSEKPELLPAGTAGRGSGHFNNSLDARLMEGARSTTCQSLVLNI